MHESNHVVSQAQIKISGLEFLANLIILKLGNDVDVLLGMKWMVKHQCVIRCVPRSIEIPTLQEGQLPFMLLKVSKLL